MALQRGLGKALAVLKCIVIGHFMTKVPERAALAAISPSSAAATGVMRAGHGCYGLVSLLVQDRVDGGVVRLPGAVSPQLVGAARAASVESLSSARMILISVGSCWRNRYRKILVCASPSGQNCTRSCLMASGRRGPGWRAASPSSGTW